MLAYDWNDSLLYRNYLILGEQKIDLEDEIRAKEQIIWHQKLEIRTKERELFRLELKLKNLEGKRRMDSNRNPNFSKTSTIYIITPTYARASQKADLTRLSYTLSLVSNIYWIVVEDSDVTTDLVEKILIRSKIRYALLNAVTPTEYKLKLGDPSFRKPRGVAQRNEGLKWIRKNLSPDSKGIVYFADDDNTYDIRLFDEMRTIRKVGVWPVAFVGQLMVERPKVENGRVTGYLVAWGPERHYAIDMAGFAVNLELILKSPQTFFSYNASRGFQETYLLRNLITGLHDLEPKADNCTKVYVWHTKTQRPNLLSEIKGVESDFGIEI
uniref:Galactosylgalactosylxylosylprotein 3-beta-glucuronosyltransferase n=1 Tax=Romanomermis culicivorax TaxID=13658 RepID=A0A915I4V8_ROMCU